MNISSTRKQAGYRLAQFLEDKIEVDYVCVPNIESLQVAEQVASSQNAELIPVLSSYLKIPGSNREIGAVTQDGTIWIDDNARPKNLEDSSNLNYWARKTSNNLNKISENLMKGRLKDVKDSRVAVISDSVTDGYREMAVSGTLLKRGVQSITIATLYQTTENNDLRMVSNSIYSLENSIKSDAPAFYKQEKNLDIEKSNDET